MNAALPLPPQARPVSERLAAVVRALRNLTPTPLKIDGRDLVTVSDERRAAWVMLRDGLHAYALLASIPADSALSGVPRDLAGARALWVEVRDATTARLVAEVRAHARGGSPLADRLRDAMRAAAKAATTVDGLFEDLAGGRL